jgi:hypothetical protein
MGSSVSFPRVIAVCAHGRRMEDYGCGGILAPSLEGAGCEADWGSVVLKMG